MKRKFKLLIRLSLAVILVLPLVSCSKSETERITVRLAAPQSTYIKDFDTNTYKLWLEEQTGLNIEIIWLPLEETEKIVREQLQSGKDLPDAYIGFGNYDIFKNPNIQTYGEQGVILPLNSLIEQYGDNTKAVWAELSEYKLQSNMTSPDGNIYFMPGFRSSVITRFRQLMWVNKGWLEELELPLPTTTDEFRDMLRAFKERYPDRIPMAGTEAYYGKQPYEYLFNAFIYNDTNNFRLLPENGVIEFAPIRDEWREALIYMRGLHDEGLYWPYSFVQDNQQMSQIANDPDDMLGAFLSPGITYTVLQNSPEIMSRYTGLGPLMGPEGVKLSTVITSMPKPNGVITSACEHPEEVLKLFDLMLSKEASLMGRYGERGIDWEFAEDGDISMYGTPATIRIRNQIWNTTQNKHLCQIVPYISRPVYSGGVTWDGNTTDGEYMNAQTAMMYQDFAPKEYITTLIFTPEEEELTVKIRTDIEAHVKETIIDFITGKRDIYDDAEWQKYLCKFDNLGLTEFLSVAQKAWDRQMR